MIKHVDSLFELRPCDHYDGKRWYSVEEVIAIEELEIISIIGSSVFYCDHRCADICFAEINECRFILDSLEDFLLYVESD